MFAMKLLVFVALAIACVFAADERVKKDVLLGTVPYAYSGVYSGAYIPTAYSAGYVAPAAYPAAYSGYPYYGSVIY